MTPFSGNSVYSKWHMALPALLLSQSTCDKINQYWMICLYLSSWRLYYLAYLQEWKVTNDVAKTVRLDDNQWSQISLSARAAECRLAPPTEFWWFSGLWGVNAPVMITCYKKPSYRWGTARRGRASWNLVKFCTNVDDLYLKSSETRLLPIRL